MLVVFIVGLSLNFSIFMRAQRLWGFYLFPGTVLMMISIIAICEKSISFSQYSKNTTLMYSSVLTLPVMYVFFALYFLIPTILHLEKAATRTSENSYLLELQSYNQA